MGKGERSNVEMLRETAPVEHLVMQWLPQTDFFDTGFEHSVY